MICGIPDRLLGRRGCRFGAAGLGWFFAAVVILGVGSLPAVAEEPFPLLGEWETDVEETILRNIALGFIEKEEAEKWRTKYKQAGAKVRWTDTRMIVLAKGELAANETYRAVRKTKNLWAVIFFDKVYKQKTGFEVTVEGPDRYSTTTTMEDGRKASEVLVRISESED